MALWVCGAKVNRTNFGVTMPSDLVKEVDAQRGASSRSNFLAVGAQLLLSLLKAEEAKRHQETQTPPGAPP